MLRWFDLLLEHKKDLLWIIVAEQGQPLSEAHGEIDYAVSFIKFQTEEAKRPNVVGVTSHLPAAEVELWLEPVRVVALITPWKFSIAMPTRKAAAVLAAGCTIVAHPSSETPFRGNVLAELARRAGFAQRTFNVVAGKASTVVPPGTADPRVRALSFTGSTEVGCILRRDSASTTRKPVMALGGHAPVIMFKGADLDHAVHETINAKFATSGQDCLGANRNFVERPNHEEFYAGFTATAKRLSIGSGMQDPDISPLMNENAVAKQEGHVADALAKGAKLTCGDRRHAAGPLFYEPNVQVDALEDAAIMHEESFGPLTPITPFDTQKEVIAKATDTDYGLVAYLHSQNPRRNYRVSRR